MSSQNTNINVPGQFAGSSMMVLATRGSMNPMPEPASEDLTELLEDQDEYQRRISNALQSPYTRDILDGAIAASMLGSDGENLIPLFGEIIDDCHQEKIWQILEPVDGVTLQSTLFMIEVNLLIAIKEIGSSLGLPLVRRALSDQDDSLHTFALDAIKAIGPNATEAVPDLLHFIQADEPTGLSDDHFEYRRSLRREACVVLGAIGSVEAISSIHILTQSDVPECVRDSAERELDIR